MVAIVDYGMGNVRSVERAFASLGAEVEVTRDAAAIEAADRIVLPGVGAFGVAMQRLHEFGLVDPLRRRVVEQGAPFLGVCLGMQLVCRQSDEHGTHTGLGWVDAAVRRLDVEQVGLRIPHVGWNDVTPASQGGLVSEPGVFYFVHSLVVVPDAGREDMVTATCAYGTPFAAALERGNIAATQFHPEKSQTDGLALLRRFLAWQPAELAVS